MEALGGEGFPALPAADLGFFKQNLVHPKQEGWTPLAITVTDKCFVYVFIIVADL